MDGQTILGVNLLQYGKRAVLMLGVLLAPAGMSAVRGQAMGKATIDAPTAAEDPVAATAAPVPTAAPRNFAPAPAAPAASATPATETPAAPTAVAQPAVPSPAPQLTISPDILRVPANPRGLSMPALPPVLSLNAPQSSTVPEAPSIPPVQAAPVPPADVPAATAPAAVTPEAAPHSDPTTSTIEQKPIRPRSTETDAAVSPVASAAGASPDNKPSFSWPSGVGSMFQAAAALAVVLGLIFIGRGLARKFIPGARAASGKGVVEILARHPLCKNQSLVLVRIGSQIVALNQCKESSESVLVISDSAEVARIIGQIEGRSPTSIQAGFNSLLANARMDLEQNEEEAEPELRGMNPEKLDEQLDEMAAAKRQLMELRQHVRSVRDKLPRA